MVSFKYNDSVALNFLFSFILKKRIGFLPQLSIFLASHKKKVPCLLAHQTSKNSVRLHTKHGGAIANCKVLILWSNQINFSVLDLVFLMVNFPFKNYFLNTKSKLSNIARFAFSKSTLVCAADINATS